MNLTPQELWIRYAATWSADATTRERELAACLTDDATYCDPNGTIHGTAALSTYMENFQQAVPEAAFHIQHVHHHHGRSLASWTLINVNGETLQQGTSFAISADDGRLAQITGFFQA